jgi:Kef-type K+ transport system membrane component KefB
MTDTQLAALFFLQVAAILAACRAVGWLLKRMGQPQVVGEMVAGFLMGPSLFGWLAPEAQSALFPPISLRIIFVVSQLALVLYMFSVGLEFRVDFMVRHARRAAAVSIAGIAVPFALGAALALMMFPSGGFFGAGVQPYHAVLFIGAAMSITAFPMLARIISERGIAGTALGTLALAAGAMNDAAAWIILAIVVGSFTGSTRLAVAAAGGAAAYVAAVGLVGRPILARLNARVERDAAVAHWVLGVTLSMLAFGAWFTDLVGIHSVFGAFILGAGMPRGLLSRELQRHIAPITTALLVPLFFVYSGLNSQLSLVNSGWLWTVTILIFLAACVGKGVACWGAARLSGASPTEALGVATLMNARGMMELILLNIGLQRGLITPTLFTILVMMAIGTTVMTGPLFGWVYRKENADAPAASLAMEKIPS